MTHPPLYRRQGATSCPFTIVKGTGIRGAQETEREMKKFPVGTKVLFTARKRHPFYDAKTQECVMLYCPLELSCSGLVGEVIGIPRDAQWLRCLQFPGGGLNVSVTELELSAEVVA